MRIVNMQPSLCSFYETLSYNGNFEKVNLQCFHGRRHSMELGERNLTTFQGIGVFKELKRLTTYEKMAVLKYYFDGYLGFVFVVF